MNQNANKAVVSNQADGNEASSPVQLELMDVTIDNCLLKDAGIRDGQRIFTKGGQYVGVFDELPARMLHHFYDVNVVVITGKNEDGTYTGYSIPESNSVIH